jgi:cell pole-organizing protein PopZ
MSEQKAATEPSMEEILATIRRIIAEDERQGVSGPAAPKGSEDVLVLTEAVEADGSVRHIAPTAAAAPVPPLPGGRVEPGPPRPDVAADASPVRGERLMSSAVSDAAVASFARLNAARDRGGPETPIGRGDKTLEDIVRELLRPLLQAWLDENLPPLVERLVQKEIARVIGEANLR